VTCFGGMFSEECQKGGLDSTFNRRIVLRIFGGNGGSEGLDVGHGAAAVEVLRFTTGLEVFFSATDHDATAKLAGEDAFVADEAIVTQEG